MAEFRARSNPELVDTTLQLYRRHFSTLFALSILAALPGAIGTVLQKQSAAAATSFNPFSTLPLGITLVVASLLSIVIYGALVIFASDLYLGKPAQIGAALQASFGRFFSMFGLFILMGLAIMIGFICLFIPGFFVIAWFAAALPVLLVERKPIIDSMQRSKALSKGYVGKILLLLILTGIAVVIVNAALSAILGLLSSNVIVSVVCLVIVSAALQPIFPVLTVLLYYDLRIRQEGYDLELMANTGSSAPMPA